MTKKTFTIYKIIVVVVVAAVVSVSVSHGNWYLPIAFFITASALLYVLRSKVKEVIEDERDYFIAGKASGLAIRIYASLSVIVGLIIYTAQKENEVLFAAGNVLLYSACFLMLLYAILFKIYEKKDERD